MEALSLTGFKTRSIISLFIVISVLLLTFGIQQQQLTQQQKNVMIADLASNLSEHTKSIAVHLEKFPEPKAPGERERLKLKIIEDLSRLSESLNYLENSTELPEKAKTILSGKEGISAILTRFIQFGRDQISDTNENTVKLHFDSSAFGTMIAKQTDLTESLSLQITEQNQKQLNTLKQLFTLSLSLIVIGILFVVVPVLRRVKNDRTAIEKQREQITRIRKTFDTFTEHSQNGILNFELHTGIINFLNHGCINILEYDEQQQLMGKPLSSITALSVEELSESITGLVMTSTGEEIPVVFDSFRSNRIEDGVELVWLNITDLRPVMEMESRSQNAKKMESMGTLASGIAHDFNNILAIIRGSSELLKLSTTLSDKPQKCLEHIIEAGERGAGMVRQILQFSRADTDFLQVIDIAENIQQTIEILTPGLKKKCEVEFNNYASGNILADQSSVSQILINLVKNAAQAGASKVILTLNRKNDEFILNIADNGSGITKEVQDKIFEPFFSTKKKTEGTGLGLSVVHGIVEKLKGNISISSELHKGTNFVIRLPVCHLEIESQTEEIKEKPLNRAQQVLLVEDEDNLRNVYATYLGMKGFQVTEASNGEEAVAIYQQSQNDFDILLTDHNMPGLLGTEVILAIRHLSKSSIKTIMVTGDIEEAARELQAQGLIDQILVKPIALTALDSAINKLAQC